MCALQYQDPFLGKRWSGSTANAQDEDDAAINIFRSDHEI